MQKQRDKEKTPPPPVPTGHDDRAEKPRARKKPCAGEAPDGISGNWS